MSKTNVRLQDLVKTFGDTETKSGKTLNRSFCSNCVCTSHLQEDLDYLTPLQGSSLFVAPDQTPGLIVINAGVMDGPRMAPKREFFKENKESWLGEITSSAKM